MENLWFLGVPIFKHIRVSYHTDPLFMLQFRAIEGHGIMSEYYLSYIKTKIVSNVRQMILKIISKTMWPIKFKVYRKKGRILVLLPLWKSCFFMAIAPAVWLLWQLKVAIDLKWKN